MTPRHIERLENIKQQLVAITKGDFNGRIPRTDEDDEIECIGVLLNRIVEEIKDMLSAYAENLPRNGVRQHLHLVFIINQEDRILHMSPDVGTTLGHIPDENFKKSFSQILAQSHIDIWQACKSNMFATMDGSMHEELLFKTDSGLKRWYHATINSIYIQETNTQYLMVIMFEPSSNQSVMDVELLQRLQRGEPLKQSTKGAPNVIKLEKDRQTLQQIHHYLLQNLDKPFPGLKELAKQFGTNEFKLKNGFKQLFGNSVFEFFREERMKKGLLLLESTDLPIKTIAGMCGYSSGSHFSKDFKFRYGVAPGG